MMYIARNRQNNSPIEKKNSIWVKNSLEKLVLVVKKRIPPINKPKLKSAYMFLDSTLYVNIILGVSYKLNFKLTITQIKHTTNALLL